MFSVIWQTLREGSIFTVGLNYEWFGQEKAPEREVAGP